MNIVFDHKVYSVALLLVLFSGCGIVCASFPPYCTIPDTWQGDLEIIDKMGYPTKVYLSSWYIDGTNDEWAYEFWSKIPSNDSHSRIIFDNQNRTAYAIVQEGDGQKCYREVLVDPKPAPFNKILFFFDLQKEAYIGDLRVGILTSDVGDEFSQAIVLSKPCIPVSYQFPDAIFNGFNFVGQITHRDVFDHPDDCEWGWLSAMSIFDESEANPWTIPEVVTKYAELGQH